MAGSWHLSCHEKEGTVGWVKPKLQRVEAVSPKMA